MENKDTTILRYLVQDITAPDFLSQFGDITKGLKEGYIVLTPLIANSILQRHSGKNRRIAPTYVNNYQDLMRNGNWYACIDALIFTKKGVLCNGYHRLTAISGGNSDLKVPIKVYYDFPDEYVKYIDTGKERSLVDVVSMFTDLDNVRSIVAVSNGLRRVLEFYHMPGIKSKQNYNNTIQAIYIPFKDQIDHVNSLMLTVRKNKKTNVVNQLDGTLFSLLAIMFPAFISKIDEYIEKYITGLNIQGGEYTDFLKRMLTKNLKNRWAWNEKSTDILRLILLFYNMHIMNETEMKQAPSLETLNSKKKLDELLTPVINKVFKLKE